MFSQILGLFAIISLVITGICMDNEIDKLNEQILQARLNIRQLTVDYEQAVELECDRILAMQTRIRSIHHREFQEMRQKTIDVREKMIQTLRIVVGDSQVVDWIAKSPTW